MYRPGRLDSRVLPTGRLVEFWDGGDPAGRPVLIHSGTPDPREAGRLSHRLGLSAGLRLICLNRPGYGGTTPADPSLAIVGRDAAGLAVELGLDEYGVVGMSGGGPFAVATAVVDPTHVRAVGVVAGMGPWRVLDDPSEDSENVERAEGRILLAQADAGDLAGARAGFVAEAVRDFGGLADLDDEARVAAFMGGYESPRLKDPEFCDIVADEIRVVLESFHGYAFDSLAWGGPWDVDPSDVRAATTLWYGADDDVCPPRYGQWLADRIAGSKMVVFPGADHMEAITGHKPEVFAALLAQWP
jgi:pimeloyl-ACP methyl ester carboxylesterase